MKQTFENFSFYYKGKQKKFKGFVQKSKIIFLCFVLFNPVYYGWGQKGPHYQFFPYNFLKCRS